MVATYAPTSSPWMTYREHKIASPGAQKLTFVPTPSHSFPPPETTCSSSIHLAIHQTMHHKHCSTTISHPCSMTTAHHGFSSTHHHKKLTTFHSFCTTITSLPHLPIHAHHPSCKPPFFGFSTHPRVYQLLNFLYRRRLKNSPLYHLIASSKAAKKITKDLRGQSVRIVCNHHPSHNISIFSEFSFLLLRLKPYTHLFVCQMVFIFSIWN
jgi:hypothetical protein